MKAFAKYLPPLKILQGRAEQEAARLPSLMAEAQKTAATMTGGDHAQRKAGGGEKFWQFREYNITDRPQDIDWRQSAKGDRIFIRQKEWQTPQSCLFWVSSTPNMAYRSAKTLPSKGESALVTALTMALLLSRAGEKVGALSGSHAPSRSAVAVEHTGRDLLERAPALTRLHESQIPPQSELVLLSDFLDPIEEIEACFKHLAARVAAVTIIQILDPAELTLPFSGHVIFESQDTDNSSDNAAPHPHSQPIANVDAIREKYLHRLRAHQGALAALCRKYQWPYLVHGTDQAIGDSLLALARSSRFRAQKGGPV